jgi:hypothetical protein
MNRRQVLAGLGGVVGIPVAGLAYKNVVHCGPGDTAMGDIVAESGCVVTVKGDIVEKGRGSILLSDGTGRVLISTRQAPDLPIGKCLWARGTVSGCIGCSDDVRVLNPVVFEDSYEALPGPEMVKFETDPPCGDVAE